jgi:hypothetical protein
LPLAPSATCSVEGLTPIQHMPVGRIKRAETAKHWLDRMPTTTRRPIAMRRTMRRPTLRTMGRPPMEMIPAPISNCSVPDAYHRAREAKVG